MGQIGEGGYFGEKALIEKVPRAATVVATVDLKIAVMDVATFERIMVSVVALSSLLCVEAITYCALPQLV